MRDRFCKMYRDVVVSVTLICAFVGSAHSRVPYTKCGVNEYQCDDGQCVDLAFRCDGTIHCKDASDESVFRCEKLSASNCTSSDDEDSSRCSSSRSKVRTGRRISPLVARFRRRTSRTATSTCLVPPQPKNGRWKLERSFCDSEVDCNIPQGIFLGLHYELVYQCNGGAKMKGGSRVMCEETGNWTNIPVCIDTSEIKCSRLNSESTNAVCYHEDKQTDCDIPVPPGTRAELSCRTGYKEDLSSTVTRRDKIVCDSKGFWSPDPISCVPICGVVRDRQIPSLSNDTAGKISDLPWHATLYKEKMINGQSKKEFVCGATIIHTRIVLTAAHCVYDEKTRSTPSPSTFYVSAGDAIKDYDSTLHNPEIVQRSKVRNIHTHCPYHGSRDDYLADIALLELDEPFVCTGILLPACLDVSGHENKIVGPGSIGKVPGFGEPSTGTVDAIMETITVPYASYDQCRLSRQQKDDIYLITDDKFCTGPADGKKTCRGDRGAGLVFEKNNHWYVMGVASVAFKSQDNDENCVNHPYGLYTKVSSYIRWIQNLMYALEFNEHVTPCDLDCSSLDSETTVTTCFSKDQWKSCDSYVPPNTKAKISCRPGYIKSSNGTERVVCKTNGKWDPEPDTCLLFDNSSVSVSTAVNKDEVSESSTSSSSVSSSSIQLPEASASISTAQPIVETSAASTATSTSPSTETDASVATSVSSILTQELPTSKPDTPSHDDVHSISVPVNSKADEILNPLHTPESDPSSVANGSSLIDNDYSIVPSYKVNESADKQQVLKLDLPQLPPPIAANETSDVDAALDSPAEDVYSVLPPPKSYKPVDNSQFSKLDLPQLPPPIAADGTSEVDAAPDLPAEDVYSVLPPPKSYKPVDNSQFSKLDLPQLPPPIAADGTSEVDAALDLPAEDLYSVLPPPKSYKLVNNSQYIESFASPFEENGVTYDGRGNISEKMCANWTSQIEDNASLSNESKDSGNDFACPKYENHGSILVAKPIKVKEFPFLAIIGSGLGSTGTQWLCSGALISLNFVLSIALCARNKEWVADRIRLGDVDITRTNQAARPQDRRIIRTIIHPKFKSTSIYNHLVLFKVKDPFEINAWVRPACLHKAPTIESSSVIVTGYGRIRDDDREAELDARKISLNFYLPSACNASYQNNKFFPGGIDQKRVFCMNGSHLDACQISGIGSPVVILSSKHTCMWELVGLNAYSNHCGLTGPIVSPRIYHYINWIESVIWPQAEAYDV